jgi:hypothetical protein
MPHIRIKEASVVTVSLLWIGIGEFFIYENSPYLRLPAIPWSGGDDAPINAFSFTTKEYIKLSPSTQVVHPLTDITLTKQVPSW